MRIPRTGLAILSMVLILCGLFGATAHTSTAAGCPGGAVLNGSTCTATFAYTGANQTFTVPSGVTSLTIVADGASGGTIWQYGSNAIGPLGGQQSGTLSVFPGNQLTVVVGGAGGNDVKATGAGGKGGFGGGGDGGGSTEGGGGGGGGSFVYGPGNALLIAAGGGGGDAANAVGGPGGVGGGAGGGTSGATGQGFLNLGVGGTGGGTGISGGAAGANENLGGSFGVIGTAATKGNSTQGGKGGSCTVVSSPYPPGGCPGSTDGSGGGGGGGYLGGGGGGQGYNGGGGGGGGTGFVALGATNTAAQNGVWLRDGRVTISFPAPGISGQVVNKNGIGVDGVTIAATPQGGGVPLTTTTANGGLYSLIVPSGIFVVAPTGLTQGTHSDPESVTVDATSGGGTANFTLTPGPVVSSVNPTNGPAQGAKPLTVSGAGFGNPGSADSVQFCPVSGGGSCRFGSAVFVAGDTVLSVTPPDVSGDIPANQGSLTVDIVVTDSNNVSSLKSPNDRFIFEKLSVKSVDPPSALPDKPKAITITGSGFLIGLSGTATVTFVPTSGGTSMAATSVQVVSDTTITAMTPVVSIPAGQTSLVTDVQVTVANLTSPVNRPGDTFTFAPLQVLSLDHRGGPVQGGTVVQITGSGFTGATNVIFDPGGFNLPPLSAPPVFIDDSHLQITTPPFTGTLLSTGTAPYDLRVVVGTGPNANESPLNSAHDQFTYGQTFIATPTPGVWPSAKLQLQGSAWAQSQQIPVAMKNKSTGITYKFPVIVADSNGEFDVTFALDSAPRMCQVDVQAFDLNRGVNIPSSGPILDGGLPDGEVLYAAGTSTLGQGSPLKSGDELCSMDPVPAKFGHIQPEGLMIADQQPGARVIYAKIFSNVASQGALNYGAQESGGSFVVQGLIALHLGASICTSFAPDLSVRTFPSALTLADAFANTSVIQGACPAPQPRPSNAFSFSDPTALAGSVQVIPSLLYGGTLSGFDRSLNDMHLGGKLTLENAVYYVDGNLSIDSGLQGTGALFVTKSLLIHGGISLATDNVIAIMVKGDVVFDLAGGLGGNLKSGGGGSIAPNAPSVTSAPLARANFSISVPKSSGSIKVGQIASLSFTVANPNASSSLSNVGFTDTLPAGLAVATPSGLAGSCGGGAIVLAAGGGSLSLSGASLAPGASCTFSLNLVGTGGGLQTNTTSSVTSLEGGPGAPASASITVIP